MITDGTDLYDEILLRPSVLDQFTVPYSAEGLAMLTPLGLLHTDRLRTRVHQLKSPKYQNVLLPERASVEALAGLPPGKRFNATARWWHSLFDAVERFGIENAPSGAGRMEFAKGVYVCLGEHALLDGRAAVCGDAPGIFSRGWVEKLERGRERGWDYWLSQYSACGCESPARAQFYKDNREKLESWYNENSGLCIDGFAERLGIGIR